MNICSSYSNKEKFALFSCAITILWQYVPFDGAGRIPLLLLTVSTLVLVKDMFERKNRAILLYFTLTIYVFINALLKESVANFDENGVYLIFVSIFKAPMVMLSMTILFRKNFDITLKSVTYIFLLFAFCALIFGSKDETYDGRYSGGTVAINELALYMTCCIDCLILLYIRKQIVLSKAIFLSIIPLALLLLTASRTSMLMLVIFVLGTIAIFFNKRNIKRSLVAVVILTSFLFALNYMMEHTQMGGRLRDTTTQIEDKVYKTGTVLDYFGDRGIQYYFSWSYFLNNKWTGIGFLNWGNFSPTGHIVHSDYLYVYLENGIIGFCLYLSFFVSLFKSVSKKRFICQNHLIQNRTRILLIVFLISVLTAASATRIYSQPEIFIFYAMILALPYSGCYSKV